MTKANRTWAGATVAVCILLSTPVWSHPHPDQPNRNPNLEEVLDGLERGMIALEQLERERELDMLRRVADEVRREMRGDRGERARRSDNEIRPRRERERRRERPRPDGNVENRIEVMRLALPALLEANRRDAAELIERAIHALEMDAHRRRDDEAATIRKNAPSVVDQIELLQMASRLWREFGRPERAVMVGELAEQLAAQSRRGRRSDEPRGGLRDEDRRRIREMQEQVERLQRALQDMQRRLRGDGERGR